MPEPRASMISPAQVATIPRVPDSIVVLMEIISTADVYERQHALLLLVHKCVVLQERMQMYDANGVAILSNMVQNGATFVTQLYALECLVWATFDDSKLSEPEFKVLAESVRDATLQELSEFVDVLQHGSEQEKEDTAVLCAAIVSRGQRDAMRDVGVVPPLVELLRNGTVLQKRWASEVLGTLACGSSDTNRVAIARDGAISPLVAILRAGPDVAKLNATAALGNVAFESSANATAIVEEGAISPLVALLRTGTDKQKQQATSTLGILAYRNREHCGAIATEGGISVLVGLLQTGSAVQKQYAAATLGILTVNGALCEVIVLEGAIPLLVALLRADTSEQKIEAAAALGNLAVNNDRNQAAIAREGAIPPLVALTRTGTEAQRTNATYALTHLGKNDANAAAIERERERIARRRPLRHSRFEM